MWSFGCVAAELYSRQPLIAPGKPSRMQSGKDFVDAIAAIVGRPGQEADVDVMPAAQASIGHVYMGQLGCDAWCGGSCSCA